MKPRYRIGEYGSGWAIFKLSPEAPLVGTPVVVFPCQEEAMDVLRELLQQKFKDTVKRKMPKPKF